MKKLLLALVLTIITASVGFAQGSSSKSAAEINVKQQSKVSSKNRKSNDSSNFELNTALEAELQNTLDVKNSKIGDEIVLKVTQNIKQDGEIVVPKGAKIIGRVTDVKEKTKTHAMSKLVVVFDRIEGKNLNAPISAAITSITNIASRTSADNDLFSSDTSANSSSTTTASRSGSSGGGLLGGVTNTVGGVVNTTTNTVGDVQNTAGRTVGGTTQTIGNTVNGIRISQSANASVSGSTTLSADNKNLKVEKGATFHLLINDSFEN